MIYATIDKLKEIENELPSLLSDHSIWNTLDIDYHPPRVERLWCQYSNDYRLFIHIIHPTNEPCLFHKHRWPASFKIVKGSYEMGISFSEKEVSSDEAYSLPTLSKFILNEGSYYEMNNTNTLHYVRPLSDFSISIMLTGSLYDEAEFRKEALDVKLKELSNERKFDIINTLNRLIQ